MRGSIFVVKDLIFGMKCASLVISYKIRLYKGRRLPENSCYQEILNYWEGRVVGNRHKLKNAYGLSKGVSKALCNYILLFFLFNFVLLF